MLTQDKDWRHDGVEIVRDLNAALAAAERYCSEHSVEEIMMIGGESVYRQALPIAKRIYATEVELTLEGDAWFPEVTGDWRLLQLEAGAFEGVKFSFQTLELNE